MTWIEEVTQIEIAHSAAAPTCSPRAYSSAVQRFLDWGALLPTNEEVVLKYLAQHAQILNPRTLALALAALGKWHQRLGFEDPTKTPKVRQVLRGIGRLYGKPKVRSDTITRESLECIVTILASDTSLVARRDNALLQLGFFSELTIDKLVQLSVEDLLWDPPGLSIALPHATISKVHHRIQLAIPFEAPGALCAPTAIRTWLNESGLTSGPIFRPITRHAKIRSQSLSTGAVSLIVAKRATEAGLPNANKLSGISLRQNRKKTSE